MISTEAFEDSLDFAPQNHWVGNSDLLQRKVVAILNSRQSRFSVGSEPWVRSTLKAAEWVSSNESVLVAGVGIKTWELGIWAVAEALGGTMLLVGVPRGANRNDIRSRLAHISAQFGLLSHESLLIPYHQPEGSRSPKRSWIQRDLWILRHSDLLLPVSLRGNGTLKEAIDNLRLEGKIDARFKVDYAPRPYRFVPPPRPNEILEKLQAIEWRYLTHWTRSSADPWPGEPIHEFYRRLAASKSEYPLSASATLKRIIDERLIRASRWRMPMQQPMVSFTALEPQDMAERMTWRRRFVRPAYEPYGIAIEKNALVGLGARPVTYGDREEERSLNRNERLFFQKLSRKGAEWKNEKEWRLIGDLDLAKIDPKHILILLRTEEEKKEIKELCPFTIFTLT